MDTNASSATRQSPNSSLGNLIGTIPSGYSTAVDIAATLGVFRSVFRLGDMVEVQRPAKPPFHRITLTDATGTLDCFGWPERFVTSSSLSTFDVVEATGCARVLNGFVVADIDGVAVPTTSLDVSLALQLVPSAACPRWGLVERLLAIIGAISDPHLMRFVCRVLSDRDTVVRYLQVPGSVRHHHVFPAGLLTHHLEVAELVIACPGLDPSTRDLGIVGGLFHDLGKTRTLRGARSTTLGRLVGHEDLTLELCAKALAELETVWPDAAYTLRHVWTASSGKYGFPRKTVIASLVAAADRISAEMSKQGMAFACANSWERFGERCGDWYWRPAPPPAA